MKLSNIIAHFTFDKLLGLVLRGCYIFFYKLFRSYKKCMYIFQCKAPEILRKQTNNRFLERIVAVLPEKINAIFANFFNDVYY